MTSGRRKTDETGQQTTPCGIGITSISRDQRSPMHFFQRSTMIRCVRKKKQKRRERGRKEMVGHSIITGYLFVDLPGRCSGRRIRTVSARHWCIRRIERANNVALRSWTVHPVEVYLERTNTIRNFVPRCNESTCDNRVDDQERDHRNDSYSWACTHMDRHEPRNGFDNHLEGEERGYCHLMSAKDMTRGLLTSIFRLEPIFAFHFGIIATLKCRNIEQLRHWTAVQNAFIRMLRPNDVIPTTVGFMSDEKRFFRLYVQEMTDGAMMDKLTCIVVFDRLSKTLISTAIESIARGTVE